MSELRYTLISDGSSDKVLLNVIQWLLDDLFPEIPFSGRYADLRKLPKPPKLSDVRGRIELTQEYYPFDILFYHRDGESVNQKIVEQRINELKQQGLIEFENKAVCIIPIKMMETWLLFDVEAIKKAAGNRNYSHPIKLPPVNTLEREQDPKTILHELLRKVSGKKNRNLKNFNVGQAVHLVGEYIEDYSPLRELFAFRQFENDLQKIIAKVLSGE